MMLFIGAANSGITLTRTIVLSDVIDEDEIRTGIRREGTYFGVNAFVERFAMVLVGGSTVLVLGLSGYIPGVEVQPPLVPLGIKLGMTLLSLAALLVFLLAMKYYPLGMEKVAEIKKALEKIHKEKAKRLRLAQR
jgi:GPH family glycoside/pentoside/hexuronide:cation symporter